MDWRKEFATYASVLGAGIGLVGLLASLHVAALVLGAVGVGVLALFVTILAARYVQSRTPEFTLILVKKILVIHDREARRSTLTRFLEAKSNLEGLTEIWTRNISSDGFIDNFQVDGKPPLPEDVVREAGLIHIRKRFPDALKKGAVIFAELSYDLLDSFPTESEGIIHTVDYRTSRLELQVEFPEGRPFISARLTERRGGASHTIRGIEAQESRLMLIAAIDKVKEGGQYCLEWEWDKPNLTTEGFV